MSAVIVFHRLSVVHGGFFSHLITVYYHNEIYSLCIVHGLGLIYTNLVNFRRFIRPKRGFASLDKITCLLSSHISSFFPTVLFNELKSNGHTLIFLIFFPFFITLWLFTRRKKISLIFFLLLYSCSNRLIFNKTLKKYKRKRTKDDLSGQTNVNVLYVR